jgi:serine/threonine protein kinase
MPQVEPHIAAHASAVPLGQVRRIATRVGQWDLVELAAQGALADLYSARPAGSGARRAAQYAVKILRREWEEDSRAVAMFRCEALVGRTVCHPHLVSILSAAVATPPYYVVMPWLGGTTLSAVLADGRGVPWPKALWITRQVAEALDALQGAGWMHGDVKPGNVFLSPGGHATLLDLGFARRSEGEEPAAERCVAGTWHYMAPETFSSRPRADARSDLYSLGVVLFEMLSGRPPFVGASAAELARQHRDARIAGLAHVTAPLPDDARRLVRQMLAKEPLRRPQTPREVVDRLVAVEIATLAARLKDER